MTKAKKLQAAVQVVGTFGEVAMFFMGFLAANKLWAGMVAMLITRIAIKLVMGQLMFHRQRANLDERVEIVEDRLKDFLKPVIEVKNSYQTKVGEQKNA